MQTDARRCPRCFIEITGGLQEFLKHRKSHGLEMLEKKTKHKRKDEIERLRAQVKNLKNRLEGKVQALKLMDEKMLKLDFYGSRQWKKVRSDVIRKHLWESGPNCLECGALDVQLQAVHIIPRSSDESLQLEPSNIKAVCELCAKDSEL